MADSFRSSQSASWDGKPNLVLIGMPSSGKSTVGRWLAELLDLDFMDTDLLIEQREGCSLQQVVNWRGLRRFREIEAEVVSEINSNGHIISTGGSVVYSSHAMSHLASTACVAYLNLSLSTVLRRLLNSDSRGLAKMPSHSVADLFYRRTPMYQHWAERTVDNNWPLTAVRRDLLLQQLAPDHLAV